MNINRFLINELIVVINIANEKDFNAFFTTSQIGSVSIYINFK